MKIQRAFKVRLYPAPEQQVFLTKTLGCRFLYNKMLAEYQKRLSRKPKDSRNQEKASRQAACIHKRIANYRHNFLNQLSYRLVQDYDVIVIENLSLKGMSQS